MEISGGAILYTVVQNEILYLVILDCNSNWGFPKGHLENKETSIDAALREIKEEVGIDAKLDTDFKKELIYTMPNGIEKHSIYYIGSFYNQTPYRQIEEVQEIKMLPYEEAYNIITFDNMKQVLFEANNYLTSNQ